MKPVSRIISVAVVTLALAAGVALADGPSSSPTVVQSTASSNREVLVAIAAASSTSVKPSVAPLPPAPEPASVVAAIASVAPDGSAVVAADTSNRCDQISFQAASITTTFDALEQHLRSVLPGSRVAAIVAILDGTRSRTIANLDAAGAGCETPVPARAAAASSGGAPVICADLAARKGEINDQFDAAEAELNATLNGSELTAAIASLEVARTQANAGLDLGIAACASIPASTSTSRPNVTTLPVASCTEIRADKAAFNAELDAALIQLGGALAAGSPELTTALASIAEQRAAGNARFDTALSHCPTTS